MIIIEHLLQNFTAEETVVVKKENPITMYALSNLNQIFLIRRVVLRFEQTVIYYNYTTTIY